LVAFNRAGPEQMRHSGFQPFSAFGGFSVIQLLALLALVMVPRGILQARRHNIASRRRTMSLTYLGLAGTSFFHAPA
jgi:uncharacterized membrane protein